jgi:hypothetical protein
MYITRWVLISVALLAAFQAWLWAGQQSLAGLAVALVLALALVAAVHLPGTRFAVLLRHAWALPRQNDESDRRYRFKVALAWLLVVASCVLGCVALSSHARDDINLAGITLRVFGFVAGLMALQALIAGSRGRL